MSNNMRKLTAEERDVVTEMIALLRKGWCIGSFAVDGKGRTVDINSPHACAWCTIGAADRACTPYPHRNKLEPTLIAKIETALDVYCLAAWNDRQPDADAVIQALTGILEADSAK